MRTSENIDQIATALSAAQAEFLPVKKNRMNPHFKAPYADLDSDIEATRPALTKFGIAVVQGIGNKESEIRITTRLMHKSGQWMEDDFFVRPEKDGPQGRKSASTYGRRVGYEGMTGISPGDDDDGELAENRDNIPKYKGTEADKIGLRKLFAKHGVEDHSLMADIHTKCMNQPLSQLEQIIIETIK